MNKVEKNYITPVLRVKRKSYEDPTEKLEIITKKLKLHQGNSSLVFSLATTLEQKDLENKSYINSFFNRTKQDKNDQLQDKYNNYKKNLRIKCQDKISNNEYQILSDHSLDYSDPIHIFDLSHIKFDEKCLNQEKILCNGVKMKINSRDHYQCEEDDLVYDIYHMDSSHNAEITIPNENLIKFASSIHAYDFNIEASHFAFHDYRENEEDNTNDSDDSNGEDYYGNDYPDDNTENYFVDEDEDLSNFNQLSLFDSEIEENSFFQKEYKQCADLHGESYAKYKHNLIKERLEEK